MTLAGKDKLFVIDPIRILEGDLVQEIEQSQALPQTIPGDGKPLTCVLPVGDDLPSADQQETLAKVELRVHLELVVSGYGGLDVFETSGFGSNTEHFQRRRNYQRLNVRPWAYEDSFFMERGHRLRVRCTHQPPQAGAAAKLSSDLYGNLTYEDDFTTKRWSHLGRLDVGHPTHGGYRDRGFWVGMTGGFATSTHLVQRLSSPQPLKQLVVTADCSANGPSLGGSMTLSVGPRGEKPKWEVQTQGVRNGPLRLEVPVAELESLQDFDVHVTLHSSSGGENGDKACATLSKLTIQAIGE